MPITFNAKRDVFHYVLVISRSFDDTNFHGEPRKREKHEQILYGNEKYSCYCATLFNRHNKNTEFPIRKCLFFIKVFFMISTHLISPHFLLLMASLKINISFNRFTIVVFLSRNILENIHKLRVLNTSTSFLKLIRQSNLSIKTGLMIPETSEDTKILK